MATTKVALYNGALMLIGDSLLSTATDNTDSRYKLDAVYDNGAVDYCLGLASWNFALRVAQLDSSFPLAPAFGWQYGFSMPTDHIRTVSMTSDEDMNCPVDRFDRRGANIYSDTDPMFIEYVSNGANYGGSLSLWTPEFIKVFNHYLAMEVCLPITGSVEKKNNLLKYFQHYLSEAQTKNNFEKPVKFPVPGKFVQSRRSRQGRNTPWVAIPS